MRFVGPLRLGPELLDAGPPGGELDGVKLVVKDVIDVAGVASGAGNPVFLAAADRAGEHAEAVARLLRAGAQAIGKAHTDEFAFSLSGTNVHYGTPRNPAAPGRVPGGSSSGSAAAVAGGLAQIALGTDTAGSIRVPASYCGVYGLRPTHARVPLAGVLPLAPSFDTCGLLAANGECLDRAGRVLLGGPPADPPSHLVLAVDLLAQADPRLAAAVRSAAERLAVALDVRLSDGELAGERLSAWANAFRGRQLVEVWRAHGCWIEAHSPPLGPGVKARFAAARAASERDGAPSTGAAAEVLAALDELLGDGGALVLASAPTVAPAPALGGVAKEDLRARTMRLTCIAGLAGAPAVSLPLAAIDGLPVGICLLSRPGEDERLLAAARVAATSSATGAARVGVVAEDACG